MKPKEIQTAALIIRERGLDIQEDITRAVQRLHVTIMHSARAQLPQGGGTVHVLIVRGKWGWRKLESFSGYGEKFQDYVYTLDGEETIKQISILCGQAVYKRYFIS